MYMHVIVFHRGLGHAVGSERFDPGEGPKGASPCCVRSCAHSGYARRETPRDTCVVRTRTRLREDSHRAARSSATGARARASTDARVSLSPGRRRRNTSESVNARSSSSKHRCHHFGRRPGETALSFLRLLLRVSEIAKERSRHSWANVQRSLVRPIRGA